MPVAVLSDEDLEALLETAIRNANAPLAMPTAIKALPAGKKANKEQVQTCIEKLVKHGRIHEWPSNKFWGVDSESYAKEQVLQALSSGPLVEAEIKKKVPTPAKTLVKATLAALVKQGSISAHPKLGTRKPFGLDQPDVLPYLAGEIEVAFGKLRKLGFKKDELQNALRRYAGHTQANDVSPTKAGDAIIAAMSRLNTQASRGALVYLTSLRAALAEHFKDKDSFDRAVLDLAKQGKVQLQSHAWPGRLSDAEKEALIANERGGFFDAIGIRLE